MSLTRKGCALRSAALLAALLLLAACVTPDAESHPITTAAPVITDLLADASLWRTRGEAELRPEWSLENGVLTLSGAGGGDITTGAVYDDFVLDFEWRVARGGNSGVFYFVDPDLDAPAYHSGPEYQLLDNTAHADGQSPLTSAGAVYGLFPTRTNAARPGGQWNRARIVARNGQVTHWLNGERVAQYAIQTDRFCTAVNRSKFVNWNDTFAKAKSGIIVLQDHGDPVSFRRMHLTTVD